MNIRTVLVAATIASSTIALSAFRAAVTPADELAALVTSWLALPQPADWGMLDTLGAVRWAPLPPASLQNCAPDGGCFARQGRATIAGRPVAMIATGARSMVMHLYLRNGGDPFGEAAVLDALHAASITTVLARCPIRGSAGSTNWYRLSGRGIAPAHLSIQPAAARRANEGFVLSAGAALPRLQPNQLAMYSEQCDAGAAQTPVATSLPHEQLADRVVALLPRAGATLTSWKALPSLASDIAWDPAGPRRGDLSSRNDRNPYNLSGHVTLAGRELSLLASGTANDVTTIYVDEVGMHPRGEHLLGVVYQKGIVVQLARCGPVYTQSTNNWYALTSPGTRPVMFRQSLRYDGTQVQDAYELRFDGSLPPRDPRDRNPGVNGCR